MNNIAKELFDLQSTENQGRGVDCVRSISIYIERNDWRAARNCVNNEWDKIRSYPTIVEFLEKHKLKEPEHHYRYRQAWDEYRTTIKQQRKLELEKIMDQAQDNFTRPEWAEFKKTLPG